MGDKLIAESSFGYTSELLSLVEYHTALGGRVWPSLNWQFRTHADPHDNYPQGPSIFNFFLGGGGGGGRNGFEIEFGYW